MADHTVQIRALRSTAERLVAFGSDAAKRCADAHNAAANLFEQGDEQAGEIAVLKAARAFEALSPTELRWFREARHGTARIDYSRGLPSVDHDALRAIFDARWAGTHS